MTPTRIKSLGLARIGTEWRFCDISDHPGDPFPHHPVGPRYRTKMEALADLSHYALTWEGGAA